MRALSFTSQLTRGEPRYLKVEPVDVVVLRSLLLTISFAAPKRDA